MFGFVLVKAMLRQFADRKGPLEKDGLRAQQRKAAKCSASQRDDTQQRSPQLEEEERDPTSIGPGRGRERGHRFREVSWEVKWSSGASTPVQPSLCQGHLLDMRVEGLRAGSLGRSHLRRGRVTSAGTSILPPRYG